MINFSLDQYESDFNVQIKVRSIFRWKKLNTLDSVPHCNSIVYNFVQFDR